MKTYHVGIIGFGFIGKVHAYGYATLPFFYDPVPLRARVTHVCTGHGGTAQAGAAMVGAEEAVTDFRRITENPAIDVVHIDAHSDLYDELHGDRLSHACPFSRIMEEGLVSRLVQLGIRTLNAHQRAQAERFGVEVFEMRDWRPEDGLPADLAGPLYLSLDLDALDPAFAPGVSHPEPGGLSTRQLLDILQALPAPLIGADLVELNPLRDPLGLTARVAAKLLKEIAARLLLDSGV